MNSARISIQIPTEKLAPRELEVITLTAYGKTRAEIAKALSVSEETVKAYIERARVKLKAANKTHAATIALTLGLIVPYRTSSNINHNRQLVHVPQKGTAHGCKCSILPPKKSGSMRLKNKRFRKAKIIN